jgi:hypothetical protein
LLLQFTLDNESVLECAAVRAVEHLGVEWDERKVADKLTNSLVGASVDLLLDYGQSYGLLDRLVVFWNDALVDLLVE